MNEQRKRNLSTWLTALCAAALCLFSGLPVWADGEVVVTRTTRSNTEFTYTQPANNVLVTVTYEDAKVKVQPTTGDPIYYLTLAEALAEAAEGDVITLLANQTLTARLTITKSITLDLNGKTLTGTAEMTGLTVGSGGALTLAATGGGGFSTFATAVKNEGTLTLSGTPTFTSCTIAFELAEDKVITIGAALTAPASAYLVEINNPLSYKITSGWGDKMANDPNLINPQYYFASIAAGVTTRLTDDEAEFVTYVALDANVAATVPVITNGGQDDDGTCTASLDEGNVWIGDVLAATTTATPGITWQWYRSDGTTETAIDGANAATYTVAVDDFGKALIAKATQAAGAAGTGSPAADVTVASAATPAVVKKDNFGTLTAATITTDTDGKVNYVSVTITNASTGVQYIVVADGVVPTETHWALATTPTADGSLTLNQFVNVESETATLVPMKPSTSYKLYYRLIETADTKHGTTATTNGKPVNEANVAITTRAFDYLVTTQGVTYELSHDATTGRALAAGTTATVKAIPAEGTGDHKTATILATIPADNTELVAGIDVWKALGYGVTDGNVFSSAIPVTALTATTIDAIDLSAIGSSAANYGYLKVDDAGVKTLLASGTLQTTCTEEGYQVRLKNNGYYTLYELAEKDKTITDGMTAILTLPGMTGGAVVLNDKAGTALPAGTGDDADKFMAAASQKVVVEVTLPTGFEFVSDDAKVLDVTYGSTTENITLADPENTGIWSAEFTMPSVATTVSFKVADAIQSKTLESFTTPESPTGGTVVPSDLNPAPPAPTRVFSELSYLITPIATNGTEGSLGYELTSLSLTDGNEAAYTPTFTIKDATTGEAVTLPYEGAVTVSFQVPATAATTMTFTPIFTQTYKAFAFAAGKNTYFFDEGVKLRTANDDLKLYTVTAISGTSVTVGEITSKTVPASTPFIVDNATDGTIFDMYTATTDEKNAAYTTGMAVTPAAQFKGTAEDKTTASAGNGPWNMADGTKYYGFNGDDFVWIMTAGDVAAHRCWIEISSTAGARLAINWPDGSTTGIGSLYADDGDGDWYDLSGRKLQARPTQKGVYIKNGQKQVVK